MSEDHWATDRQVTADESTTAFGRWRRETGRALASAEHARVELYVRSLLPPPGAKESQRRVIRDLKRAVEGETVGDVLVDVWGERLCLCEDCRDTEPGRLLLDRVRDLQEWGEEYDASARPFFERTHQESSVTGGSYDGVVPPRVTAALYVDGALVGVFPARFGDDTYSVSDFAEAMRTVEPVRDRVESPQ